MRLRLDGGDGVVLHYSTVNAGRAGKNDPDWDGAKISMGVWGRETEDHMTRRRGEKIGGGERESGRMGQMLKNRSQKPVESCNEVSR